MAIFYEIIKSIFFFATIAIAILFLRGEMLRWTDIYLYIKSLIMPGYLVLCGVVLGYIVAYILDIQKQQSQQNYVVGFMIGTLIGIALAIAYILF